MNEGFLPARQARTDAALAEERNLLFVAITRTRDELHMHFAPQTDPTTRQSRDMLSRFLDDKVISMLAINEAQ